MFRFVLTMVAIAALVLTACRSEGGKKPEAKGTVAFEGLKNGDHVKSPLKVCMTVEGLKVEPAGEVRPGFGHHHVLVDVLLSDLDKPIPKDKEHIHMGDGSSCTTVEISPGPHTLRLLFAKGDHVPYDPPVTAKVEVVVDPQMSGPSTPEGIDGDLH